MTHTAIQEAARETPVFDSADVLVVGGGPAGTAAAIASARCGARTVLLEKYGYLGGLASGGQVCFLPKMDNGSSNRNSGLMQEWIERLAAYDGVLTPPKEEVGSRDPAVVEKWSLYTGLVRGGQVVNAAPFDPELLKIVLADMLAEAGVVTYHHCLVVGAVMEDGVPAGVIMETKEGRRAILAKRLIDATGDGDLLPLTGTAYEEERDIRYRNSLVSEVFRVRNCDNAVFGAWRRAHMDEYRAKLSKIHHQLGFKVVAINSDQNDVAWINNFIAGRDSFSIRDVSETEFLLKRSIPLILDFLRAEIPGFQNCRLLDIATSFGVRHSRRLVGRHRIAYADLRRGADYADTIYSTTCFSSEDGLSGITDGVDENLEYRIPYGALVPEKTENLLVAGRCFSADNIAHSCLNLIPYCVMTGQAAGTAMAMSLEKGVFPRDLDNGELQDALRAQGVSLPVRGERRG